MIGGHMVVQPLVGGGASGLATGPASTSSWSLNVTPGGTPVPPPPPATPLTSSTTTSASFGDEVEEPSKLVTKLPLLQAAKEEEMRR